MAPKVLALWFVWGAVSAPFMLGADLHDAVKAGDLERVKVLIRSGADVNSFNFLGATPLHDAAWSGRTDIAILLLDRLANVNARHLEAGSTPLHYAVITNSRNMVELLLSRGADVHATNRTGTTALHLAADKSMVELLVAKGANFNLPDNHNATPLENAIRSRDRELVRVLMAAGAKLPKSNLLHEAVLKGQADIVQLLAEKGADIHSRSSTGSTPLHDASLKGHREIVQILLKHGANVKTRNSYGATPLHDAALSGHREVAALLLAHGADANAREEESGSTPLYNAAAWGRRSTVELLLEHGADVNARNQAGLTPLHAATSNGFGEIAAILRSRGAK